MRRIYSFIFVFLCVVALLLSGCGAGQILGPTFTPTFTNTPVPTFTPTNTATPVPTLTPTATNTPLPTQTPTPSYYTGEEQSLNGVTWSTSDHEGVFFDYNGAPRCDDMAPVPNTVLTDLPEPGGKLIMHEHHYKRVGPNVWMYYGTYTYQADNRTISDTGTLTVSMNKLVETMVGHDPKYGDVTCITAWYR